LHITLDQADKATGTLGFLERRLAIDPTLARQRFAFIGDSDNDGPCFSGFRTTIGVKNLSGRSTVPPRFVTRGAKSAGFIEAARVLIARQAKL
jgi:hydroxymethylpyrimidine pyrophosphatase-like HAD family hydrolase